MAHGKTNLMRNIRGPISARRALALNLKTRIIYAHGTGSNRAERRSHGERQPLGISGQYVNPARDARPGKHRRGRRLRRELRAG